MDCLHDMNEAFNLAENSTPGKTATAVFGAQPPAGQELGAQDSPHTVPAQVCLLPLPTSSRMRNRQLRLNSLSGVFGCAGMKHEKRARTFCPHRNTLDVRETAGIE